MKTIKAKVHMLPTDKTSDIISDYNGQPIPYTLQAEPSILTEGYFHLYITPSDEEIKRNPSINEIKEGDWLINIKPWSMKIIQATKMIEISEKQNIDEDMESFARKIIATTDSLLSHVDVLDHHYLPWIPQSFIEDYCKAGGIDEVLVEVEYLKTPNPKFDRSKGVNKNNPTYLLDETNLVPKTRNDNTIIIHPVEEKMYTLKQIKHMFDIGRDSAFQEMHFDEAIKYRDNELNKMD